MTTILDLHAIGFALVADAERLMDAVEPGATVLTDHTYGPVTIRTRRVYTPERDSLTLIAMHGDDLAASVIATTKGSRVSARIHQMRLAELLFTRHGGWGFVAIGRVEGRRRRFELTATRDRAWQVQVNSEDPTVWPSLTAAAEHITTTYAPVQ
jgi:hypothetical protein